MNEESLKTQQQPDQPRIQFHDKKKKNALFKYVAIMFGVAFLLILMSYVISNRSNSQAIDLLNASSQSAMANIERLQDDYRILYEENQRLSGELAELEQELQIQSAAKSDALAVIADLDQALALKDEELAAEKAVIEEAEEYTAWMVSLYELLWRASASYESGDYESFSRQMEQLSALGADECFVSAVETLTGGSPTAEYARLVQAYASLGEEIIEVSGEESDN